MALVATALAVIDTTNVNVDFGADCLFAHNLYRKLHGVPALKLSPKLSQLAINRANELAELEELNVKQNKFHGQTLGETVGSVGGFSNYNGISATQLWYSVVSKFDEEGELSSEGASFTQIVWKSTQLVGFGIAKSKSGKFYFVAEYFPSGNIRHQYEDNVFQLTDEQLVKPLDCGELAPTVVHKKTTHKTVVPLTVETTTVVPVHVRKPVVVEPTDTEIVRPKVPSHSKVVDESVVGGNDVVVDISPKRTTTRTGVVLVDREEPIVVKHTTTKVITTTVADGDIVEGTPVVELPRKKVTTTVSPVDSTVEVVTKRIKSDQVITLATPVDYEIESTTVRPVRKTTTVTDETTTTGSEDLIVSENDVTTVAPVTKKVVVVTTTTTTEPTTEDIVVETDAPVTTTVATEVVVVKTTTAVVDTVVVDEDPIVPSVTKPVKPVDVETTTKVGKVVVDDQVDTVTEPVVVTTTKRVETKNKRNKLAAKKSSSE